MNNDETLPERADVVVIGAGIVGNSLVSHLAARGWSRIVLLDKGPLPDPGGSTGHASNFIFPVDHSKAITALTRDSMNQYAELGTLTSCGAMEIAGTEERAEELRRRMTSAIAWGVEAEIIGAERVLELVPFVDPELVHTAFWTPSGGIIHPVRAGALLRERAAGLADLTVAASTEVTGIDTEHGRVTGVRTARGTIATDTVVIAAGVWSPLLARMAGAAIPLSPMVHQMVDVGPIAELEQTGVEIAYPVVRDMDAMMYERQRWADLEVGSYAHRPIVHEPGEIPAWGAGGLSPTQLPLTAEDFAPQMARAGELFGSLLDREGVTRRLAINGLLSLTPDAMPLLGETPEVRGLWSAAAVWLKEGPGVGRAVADWMTDGTTELDLHAADIARFYPHQRTPAHVRARVSEGFNKTYDIVHPREQWLSSRGLRRSPFHERTTALGAEYFEVGGWERPQWYESNRPLVARLGVVERPHEWDGRWWSPVVDAEHLAMRERGAMIDLSAFAQFDVSGPGALEFVQHMTVAQADRPVGRLIYTPVLDPDGGFRSDLTVVRLAEQRFRFITGGADGPRDLFWFTRHLPSDGSVCLTDVTSGVCTLGLWGPRARDVLAAVSDDDLDDGTFGFATARHIQVGAVPVLALRVSYVGELGWELHAPAEQGAALWDLVAGAGQPVGVVPAGIGVYGTTGRMEKGYRLMGAELTSEYNPVEAGLALPGVKRADFIGKDAYLRARERGPVATLCTLRLDDAPDPVRARYPQGGEPILTADGERIVDTVGRPSYVTSAGPAPSLGSYLLMAYLPSAHAEVGTRLLVHYMGERYPVTVASTDRTALFDPENSRMLG